MLERAQCRGEPRPDVDLDVAVDALFGPIYFRLFAGHAPLDDELVDRLAHQVLRGIGAIPGTEEEP